MKRTLLILITLVFFKTLNAQTEIPIDISQSTLNWKGFYLFYFNGHEGNVQFKEGTITKSNDKIIGGSFTVDMTTIVATDIDKEDAKADLENHLKSDDFFGVQKHPIAKLKFSKITYEKPSFLNIEAELTIKDITNPIKFNADISSDGRVFTARFKIDRQLWDVSFNYLKDGAISDAIAFNVALSLNEFKLKHIEKE